MPTYVIGDVQGCLSELKSLLSLIKFSPKRDHLWFAGDLINRGPHSLEVLRFVKQLPNVVVVLGNHELYFLLLAQGLFPQYTHHTLHTLLKAPDCNELAAWIRSCPILHHDPHFKVTMTHAGVFPGWSLSEAQERAKEVTDILRDPDQYPLVLKKMYGNRPCHWRESLSGWGRIRFIINSFTRMRYINQRGGLDFKTTCAAGDQPTGFTPWFDMPDRPMAGQTIIFGHWASLRGEIDRPDIQAIDGGCVWGHTLIAKRLEDGQRFCVRAHVTNE